MDTEKKRKVLSIVVPAYNVERYLDDTLESFVDEKILADVEIIVVDDGSRDGTKDIARKYCGRYPDTFFLVSKENGGHGSAINRGIEHAKGEYFKVVDGDDWVDTDGLAVCVEALKNCAADYVVSDYYTVHEVTKERRKIEFAKLAGKEEWEFEEIAGKVQLPMHALFIRTEILKKNGIRLDEKCFYVDVEYILFPVPYVSLVRYIRADVYMYRIGQASQSVSRRGSQKHISDYVKVSKRLSEFLETCKKKGISPGKECYIRERTAQMVADTASVFLSFPVRDKVTRSRFKEYMGEIQSISAQIYEKALDYSPILKSICESDFQGYFLRAVLYRLRGRAAWLKQKSIRDIAAIMRSRIGRRT